MSKTELIDEINKSNLPSETKSEVVKLIEAGDTKKILVEFGTKLGIVGFKELIDRFLD